VLVLVLSPARALAIFIAAIVVYPDYLRISIGTIDVSVGRTVITMLLVRCVCDDAILRRFRWSRLDTLVTVSTALHVGIYCLTRASMAALENRAGFIMDTWFVYMAFRMAVTDKATWFSFVKYVCVVLVPLAILGMVESATHWQPYLSLKAFRPWNTPVEGGSAGPMLRWGFARALGPFSHAIMFGACFVTFIPLVWALRHERGTWRRCTYYCVAVLFVGALSSMSSNAWVMAIVMLFCLIMERMRHWVKPVLIVFVLGCAFVQLASNRPFYHVLASKANVVGGVWYQRAVLIDSAIRDFGEWCLLGYGGRDPGWAVQLSGGHTDVNNEYILAGVEYGMAGVVALGLVLAAAFHGLIRQFRQTEDKSLRSLYWSFGAFLVATMTVWLGVSYFGQVRLLFYAVLGALGASLTFADRPVATAQRRSSAYRNELHRGPMSQDPRVLERV
jgi:hypothetical protein